MLFSVLSFGINIGMTMRNAWHNFVTNIPLRFILFGFINYILVSIQGSFQAMRDLNQYLHFGQWAVGHAHLALLGAFGLVGVGIMFWGVPKITGKPIFSEKLMSVTWWLAFGGFILFMIGMTTAGLVQSAAWSTGMTVATVLPLLPPYFIVRAIGGGIVVVAAYVFAVDIIMTFIQKPKTNPTEVQNGGSTQ
jgi:cytochrome c oxidase cbb3-type subunit I/II